MVLTVLSIVILAFLFAVLVVVAISQTKSQRGKMGELLIRLILKFLPREYKVYNDVKVYAGGRKCQIDHLVVSPYGIFVIETKSYLGVTTGRPEDEMWWRTVLGHRYHTRNPLRQNQYHLDLLRKKLAGVEDFNPDWLKSVVVFGFGSILRIAGRPSNVMLFTRLLPYLKRHRLSTIPTASLDSINSLI